VSSPSVATLIKLAEALEIEVKDFFLFPAGERSPGEVGGITLTNLLFAVARREAECPRRKPDSSE